MNIRIENIDVFKRQIEAINNLLDEGTFVVSNEKIVLREMDPTKIAIIDFELPTKSFQEFECKNEEKITVNLCDLNKILKRIKKGVLNVSVNKNKLILESLGESKKTFTVPLLEIVDVSPKIPEDVADSSIEVVSKEFVDTLNDAALLSSHVLLNVADGEARVEAYGCSGDLIVSLGGKTQVNGVAKSLYAVSYLQNIVKSCPSNERLVARFKTNSVIKVTYFVGDAKFNYFLAPTIKN